MGRMRTWTWRVMMIDYTRQARMVKNEASVMIGRGFLKVIRRYPMIHMYSIETSKMSCHDLRTTFTPPSGIGPRPKSSP